MSVQWREGLAEDWEDVPDDPPVRDRGLAQEPLENGVVVRERASGSRWLYVDGADAITDPDAGPEEDS